jgi:hypothetical protein
MVSMGGAGWGGGAQDAHAGIEARVGQPAVRDAHHAVDREGAGPALPQELPLERRLRGTAMTKLRIVILTLRFGTARQKLVLE